MFKVRSPKGHANAVRSLAKLAAKLEELEAQGSSKDQARIESLRRQVDDLRFHVERYELLVAGELEAALGSFDTTLDRLPELLVAARIASGLSIAQTATKLKLRQTVLARHEATGYQGVGLQRAIEILHASGANLRCKLVAKGSADKPSDLTPRSEGAISRSLQLGKLNVALHHIREGLTHEVTGETRAELLIGKVRALFGRGDAANALQTARELLNTCEQLGTDQRLATALNTLGAMEKATGLVNDAGKHYERAIQHARKASDQRTLAMAGANLAALLMETGQPDKAEHLFLEALELQRQLGDQRGEANSLANLAILVRSRDPGASIKHYERAAELHKQAGNDYGLCVTLTNLAGVETELGRIEAARKHFEQGGKLADKIESREQRGIAVAGIARLAHLAGDLDAARQKYPEALLLLTGTAEPRVEAMARANFAGLLFSVSRKAEARKEYARALAIFRDAQDDANETFYAKELQALEAGEQRYFGINPATLGAELRAASMKALRKNNPAALHDLTTKQPEMLKLMRE